MRSASPNWGSRFKNRPKWEESCLCQKATWWGSHLTGSCHFRADELCSFPEIFCHKGRAYVRSFGELADFTLPAADENSSAASSGSGQQIGDPVSNQVAFLERDPQILGCLLKQANLRFAATAALPEFEHFCFRMMEAVVDSIDVPTGHVNSRKHSALKCFHRLPLQVSFSDSGLIRHDGDFQVHVV